MKKILIILLAAFSSFNAVSQTNNTTSLSLKQAIEMGLKNRYDLQSKALNTAIADNRISKAKKEWVPEISGTANVRYNSQLQGNLIPAGFGELTEPKILAFGAANSSVFGLDFNQTLYKPGIVEDIKMAKLNKQIEIENQNLTDNMVRGKISEAYYATTLKKEQWKILEIARKRYLEYYNLAEGKYKLGVYLETDYLKSKLDYENSTLDAEKAKQSYELALIQLKYQINMDTAVPLALTDSLIIDTEDLRLEDKAINRPEISILDLQKDNNKMLVKKGQRFALPTVSLYANYSKQFLFNDFNYSKNQFWSPFSYVGLKVSLPITSNIKNSNSLSEIKLKINQNELDLKQKTADINYETKKAKVDLENAVNNFKTSRSNYELSQKIYDSQKIQYEKGSFIYANLLDTERSLSNSEQAYLRSIYEYYLAKIYFDQATGNFN